MHGPICRLPDTYKWKSNARFTSLAALIVMLTPSCGATQRETESLAPDRIQRANVMEGSVSNSPVPVARRFRTLDEYLAFLERTQGPVDGPWYKQLGPNLYELQTGNLRLDTPGGERRVFTREELERKFGFRE